jgi:ABC-2 type transport system permease protein
MRPARSIAWVLLRNEVRLAWRSIDTQHAARLAWFGGVIVVIGQVFAFLMVSRIGREGISLPTEQQGWALFTSLMFGTAFLNAERVVCERNDADLLLPAPINPRLILLTRWAGIALSALLPAALVMPFLNAAIVLQSSRYLCSYGVILLLAGAAAATGIMGALGIIRLFGIRRGRAIAQVSGAVVSAVVYLSFQLPQMLHELPAGVTRLVTGITANPVTFSLAEAGRGVGLHFAMVAIAAAILVGAAFRFFGKVLMFGYQEVAVSRRSARQERRVRPMDTRPWRAAYRKDLRLILRDPLLIAQTLPSVLYILPGLIPVLRSAPVSALAAGSVVAAGQFSNILAAVLASGEEAWDLIRMSPRSYRSVISAKLGAALTAPLSFCLICGVVLVGFGRPLAAIDVAVTSVIVAVAGGWLEISEIHPSPRSEIIRRRHQGSQRVFHGIIVVFLIVLGATGVGYATAGNWTVALILLPVTALVGWAIIAANPIRPFAG